MSGEDDRLVVTLPSGLSKRIEEVVGDSTLGYGTFDSFVLEAVRHLLERAERAAYWLRREDR